MVQLAFEWETSLAGGTFILSVIGCAEELFALLALEFAMFSFKVIIPLFAGGPS